MIIAPHVNLMFNVVIVLMSSGYNNEKCYCCHPAICFFLDTTELQTTTYTQILSIDERRRYRERADTNAMQQ